MNPTLGGAITILSFSVMTLFVVMGREFPPFQFSAMHLLMSSILITTIQFARGKAVIENWKQPLKVYWIVFLGVGAYSILLTYAFNLAAPFAVNILNYLWPAFWVLFTCFLGRALPTRIKIAGVCLSFAGMTFVFMGREDIELGWNMGYLVATIAAALYGYHSARVKSLDYRSDFLAPVMFISSLMALALHFALEKTIFDVSLTAWAGVILMGLSRCVYVLWDYCIRRGDTLVLSSMAYFTPLLSTLWFIIAGLTPANALIALAGFLIIAGCLVTNATTIKKAVLRLKQRNAKIQNHHRI